MKKLFRISVIQLITVLNRLFRSLIIRHRTQIRILLDDLVPGTGAQPFEPCLLSRFQRKDTGLIRLERIAHAERSPADDLSMVRVQHPISHVLRDLTVLLQDEAEDRMSRRFILCAFQSVLHGLGDVEIRRIDRFVGKGHPGDRRAAPRARCMDRCDASCQTTENGQEG